MRKDFSDEFKTWMAEQQRLTDPPYSSHLTKLMTLFEQHSTITVTAFFGEVRESRLILEQAVGLLEAPSLSAKADRIQENTTWNSLFDKWYKHALTKYYKADVPRAALSSLLFNIHLKRTGSMLNFFHDMLIHQLQYQGFLALLEKTQAELLILFPTAIPDQDMDGSGEY